MKNLITLLKEFELQSLKTILTIKTRLMCRYTGCPKVLAGIFRLVILHLLLNHYSLIVSTLFTEFIVDIHNLSYSNYLILLSISVLPAIFHLLGLSSQNECARSWDLPGILNQNFLPKFDHFGG